MYIAPMNNCAGDSQSRRHGLSDWLTLHELDPGTCRRMLDAMACQAVSEPAEEESSGYQAIGPDVAWTTAVEAMREFLPAQRSLIDDTFEHSAKIVVDERDKPSKSFTLDNGPGAYPTIVYNYLGAPIDSLVIAHEFAHAVQIRASKGKFVAPLLREICAFVGEAALLSHVGSRDTTLYTQLVQSWRQANRRYFGVQRERLQAALLTPDAPYKYTWNYPIARYLAIQLSDRCSNNWIWSVFEGDASIGSILRELDFPST
jgi:hypothetical protein